jgi:hypothetical protein
VNQQFDVVGRAMKRRDGRRLQFDERVRNRRRHVTRRKREHERRADVELRPIVIVRHRLVIGDVMSEPVRLGVTMDDSVVVGVVALVNVLWRHERDRPDRRGEHER